MSLKLRIIIGYDPPNSDSDYINNFCHCLDDLLNVDFTAVILGDFNFPDISWDMNTIPNQDSREFIFYDCCLNNGLHQLIHVPTYLNSSNTLDLVLTNDTRSIFHLQVIEPFSSSDHASVIYDIYFHLSSSNSTEH